MSCLSSTRIYPSGSKKRQLRSKREAAKKQSNSLASYAFTVSKKKRFSARANSTRSVKRNRASSCQRRGRATLYSI